MLRFIARRSKKSGVVNNFIRNLAVSPSLYFEHNLDAISTKTQEKVLKYSPKLYHNVNFFSTTNTISNNTNAGKDQAEPPSLLRGNESNISRSNSGNDIYTKFHKACDEGKLYEVYRYLSILEKHKLIKSEHYLYILEACYLNVTDALNLLKRMEKYCPLEDGKEFSKYSGVDTYNLIMDRACLNSTDMWNMMLQYGINYLDPDATTYKILLKQLFVEGEYNHAQQVYNQIPQEIISELSPDIEIILNEDGYLKKELLNEMRCDYFDKLVQSNDPSAMRDFLSLISKNDFVHDELYKKMYSQANPNRLFGEDLEKIAFSTSQYLKDLHKDLLYTLLLEGSYKSVKKVIESEATRIFYEKEKDMTQAFLSWDNDHLLNIRETKIFKRLQYDQYTKFARDDNYSYAKELLKKMEKNGVAHAKLYNIIMKYHLSSDTMMGLLNDLIRRKVNLEDSDENIHGYGSTIDFTGVEYLVNMTQDVFDNNDANKVNENSNAIENRSTMHAALLDSHPPITQLNEIIINQLLLEGNYAKAKSVCNDGIKESNVRYGILRHINGHETSCKRNVRFRSYILEERLQHLRKCVHRDKIEQIKYCGKVHNSSEAQLNDVYLKHTNEFLSALASNNVDDLPAIYHALVCNYGEDMYDSYELEQYVNWKNNAVLNIQQYNVLFRKYLHEKRFEDSIETLKSIIKISKRSALNHNPKLHPDEETYNIFCNKSSFLRKEDQGQYVDDSWDQFLAKSYAAQSAIKELNKLNISDSSNMNSNSSIYDEDASFETMDTNTNLSNLTSEEKIVLSKNYIAVLDELSNNGKLSNDDYAYLLKNIASITSSTDIENIVIHMFTNGYKIESVFRLLLDVYCKEGKFDGAEKCIRNINKSNCNTIYFLKMLASRANSLSKYIGLVKEKGDRRTSRPAVTKMNGFKFRKLSFYLEGNDVEGIKNCLLEFNSDPFQKYLIHFSNYYHFIARHKLCTLELLDELIEDNRSNEKFSENNNNLKFSYENDRTQAIYNTFIESTLNAGNPKGAEDIVLKLFSRVHNHDEKKQLFNEVAEVFFQEITFVHKLDHLNLAKDYNQTTKAASTTFDLSPDVKEHFKHLENDLNVCIEPLFGRLSRLQNYIGGEEGVQNALEDLRCSLCGAIGHHSRDCDLTRAHNPRKELNEIVKRDRRSIIMELPLLNRYVYENINDSNDTRFHYLPIKLSGNFANVQKAKEALHGDNRGAVPQMLKRSKSGVSNFWYEMHVKKSIRDNLQQKADTK
eukprot:g9475.t1